MSLLQPGKIYPISGGWRDKLLGNKKDRYHGGCSECPFCHKEAESCNKCCYKTGNWSLPDLNPNSKRTPGIKGYSGPAGGPAVEEPRWGKPITDSLTALLEEAFKCEQSYQKNLVGKPPQSATQAQMQSINHAKMDTPAYIFNCQIVDFMQRLYISGGDISRFDKFGPPIETVHQRDCYGKGDTFQFRQGDIGYQLSIDITFQEPGRYSILKALSDFVRANRDIYQQKDSHLSVFEKQFKREAENHRKKMEMEMLGFGEYQEKGEQVPSYFVGFDPGVLMPRRAKTPVKDPIGKLRNSIEYFCKTGVQKFKNRLEKSKKRRNLW
jgi:hypothetical protein